ncbi:hypothetical protein ACJX0J_036845, partial [Zea mays]
MYLLKIICFLAAEYREMAEKPNPILLTTLRDHQGPLKLDYLRIFFTGFGFEFENQFKSKKYKRIKDEASGIIMNLRNLEGVEYHIHVIFLMDYNVVFHLYHVPSTLTNFFQNLSNLHAKLDNSGMRGQTIKIQSKKSSKRQKSDIVA